MATHTIAPASGVEAKVIALPKRSWFVFSNWSSITARRSVPVVHRFLDRLETGQRHLAESLLGKWLVSNELREPPFESGSGSGEYRWLKLSKNSWERHYSVAMGPGKQGGKEVGYGVLADGGDLVQPDRSVRIWEAATTRVPLGRTAERWPWWSCAADRDWSEKETLKSLARDGGQFAAEQLVAGMIEVAKAAEPIMDALALGS